MKHLEIFMAVLLATASVAVQSAAGAVLTSPAGVEYTGELHATLATPNSALLQAGIEDTCGESTVRGVVTTNNATVANGPIMSLSFGDCTKTTDVIKNGSLSIGPGGVVTAKENEVTIFDPALGGGVSCVYGGGTAGTVVGILKGGSPAVIEVNTTELPKISGGILCKSEATWTAKYTVTTPATLLVEPPPPGTLTSPSGSGYIGELDASLATPTSALLKAGIEDTCGESTVKGNVTTNSVYVANGSLTSLTFGDCTKTTHVLKNGSLSIAANGAVSAIGNEVTIEEAGFSCVYGGGPSPGTTLGVLKAGTPAVLEASTTELPKISGGFLCASTGTWTAKYTVTTPSTLLVDPPPPGVLTSPSGSGYGGELDATLATPSSALLKAGIEDTCGESTVKSPVESNTEASASGKISALSFGDCTKPTTVLKNGSLEVSKGGVVTIKGNEVTVSDTALGISCVYGGGAGTKLGTLKGGTPAVLEASTTELPKISGGFFCASKGTWTAKYTVKMPSTLLVD